jgi:hypothetical protein
MRPIQLRLERAFGDKINVTFQFLGQNFKPLFSALLYLAIPLSLLSGICNALFQANFQKAIRDISENPSDATNPTDILAKTLGTIGEMFTSPLALLFMLFAVLSGVMIHLVVMAFFVAYEDTDENPIQLSTILDQVKVNFIPVLLATVVSALLALVGTFFFIIPGIYLAVVFSLINFVVVRERVGVGEAIGRCFKLIKDKWWSTFGLMIVLGICVSILGMAVAVPASIISLFEVNNLAKGEASLLYITTTAITSGFSTLLNAVLYVGLGFQYFNLVERNDSFGLKKQINNLGSTEPKRPTNEEGDF